MRDELSRLRLDAEGISRRAFDHDGSPEQQFFSDHFLERAAAEVGLTAEVVSLATRAADRMWRNPGARTLALFCRSLLLRSNGLKYRGLFDHLPSIDRLRGDIEDAADVFYLVVLLGALPELVARLLTLYEVHSIPRQLAKTTLADIQTELGDHRKRGGTWGMKPFLLGWFSLHLHGHLYRIGRFNFEIGDFELRARAYRHRTTGRTVFLSEGGVTYDALGQVVSGSAAARNLLSGPKSRWTAVLETRAGSITGNPIWPEGVADERTVSLPQDEWSEILAPGDSVLHLHIPSGGRMTFEPIGENILEAFSFMRTHFPDRKFKALDCVSWFLNAELQNLIGRDSNVVRFQREVYLLPSDQDTRSLLEAVFGTTEPASRPEETRLQRAIGRALDSGKELHVKAGACVIFPEDMDWGGEVYLTRRFPRLKPASEGAS